MDALTFEKDGRKRIKVKEFLALFNQFTKEEQIKIAEKIALKTFATRWTALDEVLPNIEEFTESEIVAEVKAVRYGKKEKP